MDADGLDVPQLFLLSTSRFISGARGGGALALQGQA
jgi:hypothetical protein